MPSDGEWKPVNGQSPVGSPQKMSVRPLPFWNESTRMWRGSISVPHQGQFVSWWGVPSPPGPLLPSSALSASSDASVVFGVVRLPTHRPMRNGSRPTCRVPRGA